MDRFYVGWRELELHMSTWKGFLFWKHHDGATTIPIKTLVITTPLEGYNYAKQH